MLRRLLLSATACLAIAPGGPAAHAAEGYRIWHEGREVTVVDQDGLAIMDGDIIMGRTDEVLARSAADAPNGSRIGSLAKSVTLGTAAGRWPKGPSGLYEMPYVIETDPDGNVPNSIAMYNSEIGAFIKAVPRTTESDYVAFTLSATDNGGACSSSVGRVGGRQVIQGSHLCSGGLLVHEMGHATGLWHEQQHPEWPAYVQYDLTAIDPARAFNFLQSTNQRAADPYDFASIMHYQGSAFSKTGTTTLETIPPGIGIGYRGGFSAADMEGIQRLYGAPPQQITVTTFPAGLTVIVDGASVVGPTVFNWAVGSSHTIDAPGNVQVLGGEAFAFGRWNVDRTGDFVARRSVTVAPGNGSITSPTGAPLFSTYTASFVRYKQVALTTSGNKAGVGGANSANPAPVSLPGVAGLFYRDRQSFSLTATPNPGNYLAGWSGSYFYNPGLTTSFRNPFRGPISFAESTNAAYEYRAAFTDVPLLTVQARAQDGEALGLTVSVARTGGTTTTERFPYNGTNFTSGQAATLTVGTAPISPLTSSIRYTFTDWDGSASAVNAVTSPATGEAAKTVTANFAKEYQPFTQVIPSCAAGIIIPGGSSSWYAHGSSVPVSLNVVGGWTFVGWEGSLSGNSTSTTLTVTDVPNLTARFNTVPVALNVTAISPTTLTPGVAASITIDGTGFTSASEVYLAGVRQASQFVSGTRLTADINPISIPSSGAAIVTVTNRVSAGGCSVSGTATIDVLGSVTTASATPQTGWWWNPSESGRGFFIEQRGANMFIAGYLYATDGRATWFSAAGPINGTTFSAAMTTFNGGQTLLGNYVGPIAGASPGNLTLTFTAADHATLAWPGGNTTLQRFIFGGSGTALPENGWWWNPSESGRGFSIETQGTNIFLAGFMYDASGNPIWYAAQGNVAANGAFAGPFQQYANGQTLTGTYQAPIVLNSNVGPLTLSFSGSRAGTLTLPNGRALAITRFDF